MIKQATNETIDAVSRIEVFEYKGRKFKVDIKSDGFDFQSHARIKLWDGDKWNLVDSIHFSNMKTPHQLRFHPQRATASDFSDDIKSLHNVAMRIVEGG